MTDFIWPEQPSKNPSENPSLRDENSRNKPATQKQNINLDSRTKKSVGVEMLADRVEAFSKGEFWPCCVLS